MTLAPRKLSGRRQRTLADLRTLAIAAAVLAAAGAIWMWMSKSAAERRESVLAGVPAFPAPSQEPRTRGAAATDPSRPVPSQGLHLAPANEAPPARLDPMTSFV